MANDQSSRLGRSDAGRLNRRLEEIAWGVFLVMTGVLWLFPQGAVPGDTWLVGAALVILGLNLVRVLKGLHASALMTALGFVALAGGVAGMYGIHLRLLPLLPIFLGAHMLVRPLMRRAAGQH
jgi:hypothetical protein